MYPKNIYKFNYIICIILILFLLILSFSPKRYIYSLPTLPLYPDNINEANIVYNINNNASYYDIQFFKQTDLTIVYELHNIIPQVTIHQFNRYIRFLDPIIISIKLLFNRARPYQINSLIKNENSETGNTPAFPAGHAFQAYYLAKILGKQFPEKQKQLDLFAQKCDEVRVKAGIHYPSDGKFSYFLVHTFF
tara:strand:+ start:81 stop:656 length:576 start_codon:yes stop_codon:yes gene_type:complete